MATYNKCILKKDHVRCLLSQLISFGLRRAISCYSETHVVITDDVAHCTVSSREVTGNERVASFTSVIKLRCHDSVGRHHMTDNNVPLPGNDQTQFARHLT